MWIITQPSYYLWATCVSGTSVTQPIEVLLDHRELMYEERRDDRPERVAICSRRFASYMLVPNRHRQMATTVVDS